ncbi:aldo/keto reductase [Actinobacteria bacterium YIM 96077]|uniref:Aldo/keto reductase n=1 Tax=Phytoactinopolyspora halophila TaxID=1981511 RepID=A0A329QI40_9ACTN|nr:aldo/keto reductase family protein [Phytoactinopolyspora halophila]AYY12388.1 aldo/keto reductase [Actinobacteria bacterium YIM 96077]RAW12035.1 aldo/keto reductase [Phytoactinopolyspora halophila]
MRYRSLGQWGIKVSEVSLGTWLTHARRDDEERVIECTRLAYDLGVNLFDTANTYPEGREGEAEIVLGKAVSVLPRDTYLIATKVFSPMGKGPLERGLSRKHVMAQIDGSLRRLGLDYIDLYQCHRYDPTVPLEETIGAMNDLIRQGKIMYWGVSEWSASQLKSAVAVCRQRGWDLPVSNQPRYSLLWRTGEDHVFPECERLGMGVLAFSPLDHGVLVGKYSPGGELPPGSRAARSSNTWMFERYFDDYLLATVQRFCAFVKEAGYKPSQVALAWCLRNPVISGVIIGASNEKQLKDNVAVSGLDIETEVLNQAEEILAPVRVS